MKVAICLSGFPRLIEYSFPYFKKYILDPLNADVFYFGYSDIQNGIFEENILELYKPKKYFIREYTKVVEEELWEKYGTREVRHSERLAIQPPARVISQFYNLYGSNELKKQYEQENNFKYDIVIRARTDYFFYRNIDKEELIIEPKHICIPDVWDFGGFTDTFAYGSSEDMDVYSSMFYNLKKYNLEEDCIPCPEHVTKYHMDKHKLIRKNIKNHFWWELSDFEYQNCQSSYIDNLKYSPSRRSFK